MPHKADKGLQSIGEIMHQGPAHLRPPTPTQIRLAEASAAIASEQNDTGIAYHHTVFCQTALPYRSVPDRVWERTNGHVSLRVEAGSALHPEQKKWINLPLPFGTKSRLILIYFDTFAIKEQSPMVEIENSMTAFLKRLQGYSPNGKELSAFKNHAAAITGSLFRFATAQGNRTFQVDTKIVTSFELWYPRDERQKTLWPSYVRLSDEYFNTLKNHAVPLDHRAVASLQHNALALDVYKWLAQRLCRVPAKTPAFLPWPAVQLQFGQGYARLRAFRSIFLKTLKIVMTQYPTAKVAATQQGLTLHLSPPPIAKLPALA
ncbi:MAG: replication protein RepA [Bryobacteraceae bacterium]